MDPIKAADSCSPFAKGSCAQVNKNVADIKLVSFLSRGVVILGLSLSELEFNLNQQ